VLREDIVNDVVNKLRLVLIIVEIAVVHTLAHCVSLYAFHNNGLNRELAVNGQHVDDRFSSSLIVRIFMMQDDIADNSREVKRDVNNGDSHLVAYVPRNVRDKEGDF
jgi:hypothetical protein